MAKWEYKDIQIVEDNTNTEAAEPVTVSEVKAFLQVEGTAYDSVLAIFITAARKQIEQYCNVSLVPKEIICKVRNPNYKPFPLPFGPVDTVTAVKWKECPSQLVTLTEGDDYDVDLGTITYINSSEADTQPCNFHQVEYTTTADTSVAFKQAIIAQAAYMYTHRDDASVAGWSNAALALCNTLKNVVI
jgi:uncharacterized phiE125 gp8 family phage protein